MTLREGRSLSADLPQKFAGQTTVERRHAVLAHLRNTLQIDPALVARAEQVASRTGQPVEQALNQLGGLSDDALMETYQAVGFEVWSPAQSKVITELGPLNLNEDQLKRLRVLVTGVGTKSLEIAACDPLDDEGQGALRFATSRRLIVRAVRPSDWRRAIDEAFSPEVQTTAMVDERRLEREIDLISDRESDGAGARLVSSVFEAAIEAGASDIHFEPRRHDLCIRLRIDGRMSVHAVVGSDLAQPAVSRVKVIANLDLGERRLPQDGRTTFVIGGKSVDVRVATSPTVFGESAVLRILDRTAVPLDLDALSLNTCVVETLRRAARAPHGLFLVTGPTGSGKTTTLYALLQTFAGSPKKVLSVEDPVEFHFEHVSQTQVAPQVGLTFAQALRSFLRQDPEVILVGEIRDPETAAVAVQAAMTGHLVLASVHANDTLGVIPRLQDMGVEPYQLAAGFRGAVAQRLVRRLCPACRAECAPEAAEFGIARDLGLETPKVIYRAVGCPSCKGTGFKGRLTVSEGVFASEALLRAIADGAGVEKIAEISAADGLRPMAADGLDKVVQGLTTLEELAGAIHG